MGRTVKDIVISLCVVVMFMITFFGVLPISLKENYFFSLTDSVLLYLLFFAGLLIAAFLITKKADKKSWKIPFFVSLIFLTDLVFVLFTKSEPQYDSMEVLNFTLESLKGDFHGLFKGYYISIYPYQLGLSFFQRFILLEAGRAANIGDIAVCELILKLANCVALSIAALFGFLTVKEFDDDTRTLTVYGLLVLFSIPLTVYSSFIYNDVFGLCLSVISLYFFIRYHKSRNLISIVLSIVSVSLAYALRSMAVIFAIAYALILLFDFLFEHKKFYLLVFSAMMLVAPLYTAKLPIMYFEQISNYEELAGQYGDKLSEGCPSVANIAMGLNVSNAYGWYDGFNFGTHVSECNFDSACTLEKSYARIRNSLSTLSDPRVSIPFFYNKLLSEWGDESLGSFNSIGLDSSNKLLHCFMKALMIFVYAFSFGSLLLKQKNNGGIYDYVFEIIVLGGFLFSIFWEAQSRYILPYYYILLINATIYIPVKLKAVFKK